MTKTKWTRSNMGHHYAGYRLRVITAMMSPTGRMYWLYDQHGRVQWDGRFDEDGNQKPYDFGEPVTDLRKAKRLVEKLVASKQIKEGWS